MDIEQVQDVFFGSVIKVSRIVDGFYDIYIRGRLKGAFVSYFKDQNIYVRSLYFEETPGFDGPVTLLSLYPVDDFTNDYLEF